MLPSNLSSMTSTVKIIIGWKGRASRDSNGEAYTCIDIRHVIINDSLIKQCAKRRIILKLPN